MSMNKTQFGKTIAPLCPTVVRGLAQYQEGSLLDPTNGLVAFDILTGGNGLSDLSISSGLLNLLPESSVPNDRRAYLKSVSLYTPPTSAAHVLWSGGTGIDLVDNTGATIAYMPASSLGGNFAAPTPPNAVALVSYNSATGVMTFAASSFVSGSMVGFPFVVTSGLGAGSVSGTIASNTATTITPVGGAAAIHALLDNTSQLQLFYNVVTSATSTVITTGKAVWATVNELNNFLLVCIQGTGQGQTWRVVSNDTTAITVQDDGQTVLDSTSVVVATRAGARQYMIPMPVYWPLSAFGSGLYMRINGTMTLGTPLRFGIQGVIF